ncbi:hypothetical protein ACRW01_21620, partial [Escherichia coli]
MKMFFTPYVRIVFYFCALIFIVYSFSDFFQGVPDSTFFSAVIMLLVIGTIVARHLDRKKSGTVAKLAMRQPFVLFKGLTFQKLCLPGAFRPG